MQCALFWCQTVYFKNILDALFEFKSKDNYERKMLNRLKETLKEKFI